ncbi:MAG: leucine-rich repeat domain-containing protein [Snowella sp.]|nr:leucine-rich repeat domain-containing protein [Snowella sp.]
MTKLNLSNNQISVIPDSIAELENLTELDLGHNQISVISDSIAELKNLITLYLWDNQISKIPNAIMELEKLEELGLNSNQINEIPNTIAKLTNLKELYLSDNQISEIPNEIAELKKLKTLDLRDNQIREIPEIILQLENLERHPDGMIEGIGLQGNPIINPPYEIAEKGIYSIRAYFLNRQLSRYKGDYALKIERSIEFPPEYWTAGTSILSYFSHILSVKYPDQNIKVRIEQEGLLLRMIIDTPEGEKDIIEQTFNDYIMVISRTLPPESLLDNPYEVMALKNKLEIAELELRQAKELFAILSDRDRQRINALEMQVSQLFSIIEKGFQKDHHTTVNIIQELSNQNTHRQINGDDISGDKVGNDKIGRDKVQ